VTYLLESDMDALIYALNIIIDLAWAVVIANVILSWLLQFEVLNIRQPQVAKLWYWLQRILEPIYAPIRRILPPMGGLDFTPLIVLIGLSFLKSVVPGQGLF